MSALSPAVTDQGESVGLDMHGAGRFALAAADVLAATAGVTPVTSGFRGYVLTYALDQPTEVKIVMDAAVHSGAEPLKPTKKALFGSFSGVFRAPDGAVWKLAASTNKDTNPAAASPHPTETAVILGVREPKDSKTFYEGLGMKVDRDYGNKYIDFHLTVGAARLCLMQRAVLAKDAGTDQDGSGFPGMILHHRAETAQTDQGYCGHFADPDGFLWKLTNY